MTGPREHGVIALRQLEEVPAHEYHAVAAQVHATMALVVMVREVRDRLAELAPAPVEPEPPADPLWDAPLYKAAAVLEGLTAGYTGAERERFIASLVLGPSSEQAADIAVHALHAARDAGGGNKVKAVEAAITTLGIELDAS